MSECLEESVRYNNSMPPLTSESKLMGILWLDFYDWIERGAGWPGLSLGFPFRIDSK